MIKNYLLNIFSLASSAAEHARRCQFGHSTADQLRHSKWGYTIGENIAVFRGPKTFETDHFVWVTDGFYDERKYYNYETGHCEAQCGHYEVLVHAEQEGFSSQIKRFRKFLKLN